MIYVQTKSSKKPKDSKKKKELRNSWDQLIQKWAKEPSVSGLLSNQVPSVPNRTNPNLGSYRRSTIFDNIPHSTGDGVAVKKEPQQYTGDNMIGIGQLHKSNAVPVFKQEDAEDLAKMRR